MSITIDIDTTTARRFEYIGEPTLTRGDYGERVEVGYEVDGAIFVFDSTFGWQAWGPPNKGDWRPTPRFASWTEQADYLREVIDRFDRYVESHTGAQAMDVRGQASYYKLCLDLEMCPDCAFVKDCEDNEPCDYCPTCGRGLARD